MLTIKTTIGPSPIDKIGLFAAEDIKAGQIIWEIKIPFDRIIHKKEMKKLSADQQNFIINTASFDGRYYCVVGDNTRFINHAPTVKEFNNDDLPLANVCDDVDNPDVIRATKDIAKGEEILMDYELIEQGTSIFDEGMIPYA